jgi:predicted DNA-binding transcriptional regulator AlpA
VLNDEILTVSEVAAMLKARKEQIYYATSLRYLHRHGYALRKFYVGKELRFRQSDIEAWIMECTNTNAEVQRRSLNRM